MNLVSSLSRSCMKLYYKILFVYAFILMAIKKLLKLLQLCLIYITIENYPLGFIARSLKEEHCCYFSLRNSFNCFRQCVNRFLFPLRLWFKLYQLKLCSLQLIKTNTIVFLPPQFFLI